jgi:hypothetical protein
MITCSLLKFDNYWKGMNKYLPMLLMVFSSNAVWDKCSRTRLMTGPNSLGNSGNFFFEFWCQTMF